MEDFADHEALDSKTSKPAGEGDPVLPDRQVTQYGGILPPDKPAEGPKLNKDIAVKCRMPGKT